MDKKSVFAIVLCVLFYLGYEFYLNRKYPERFKRQSTEVAKEATPSGGAVPAAAIPATQPAQAAIEEAQSVKLLSIEELTLENDTSLYVFDQLSGGLRKLTLKHFLDDKRQQLMDILDSPLALHGEWQEKAAYAPQTFQAVRESKNSISFSRRSGPWAMKHTVTIPEQGYGFDVVFEWRNISGKPQELVSRFIVDEIVQHREEQHGFLPGVPTGRPAIVARVSGDSTWYDVKDSCKKENRTIAAGDHHTIDFIGYDRHYFLKVLLPQANNLSYKIVKAANSTEDNCEVMIQAAVVQGAVAADAAVTLAAKGWFGPKDTKLMAAYDSRLEKSVDLGFFASISSPLMAALRFVFDLLGNWGLAIILFTIVLKFLFYPLTRQAAISMNKMKKLQPEMNRLREKYKDDPRTQQQELMRFMSTHKVNPMKGCLPILPQIPVFFAFYRVLSTSIELRQAPFIGWIRDLSVSDPYYITPLLLGVAMFFQQKLTPTTGLDKTQERIMMMLPLIFTVMMLTLPSGMVLYVLTNTVVSILQQQWLNKRLA